MKRSIQAGLMLPLIGIIFLTFNLAQATTAVQLPLAKRLQYGGVSFEGEVISDPVYRKASGFDVVDYTFQISDIIKPFTNPQTNQPAVNGEQVTFTFVRGIANVPTFTKGFKGIVVFNTPSKQYGFTAPTGLGQGVFQFSGTTGSTVSADAGMGLKNLRMKSSVSASGNKNLEITSKALGTLQNAGASEVERTIPGSDLKSVMKGIVAGEIEQVQGGSSGTLNQ